MLPSLLMFNVVTVNGTKTLAYSLLLYKEFPVFHRSSWYSEHTEFLLWPWFSIWFVTFSHQKWTPAPLSWIHGMWSQMMKKLPLNNLRNNRFCISSIPVKSLQKFMGTVYVSNLIRTRFYCRWVWMMAVLNRTFCSRTSKPIQCVSLCKSSQPHLQCLDFTICKFKNFYMRSRQI